METTREACAGADSTSGRPEITPSLQITAAEYTKYQCFLFSRNIGYPKTPKNCLFSLSKKYFLDQSIQKVFYLFLKTEALPSTCRT